MISNHRYILVQIDSIYTKINGKISWGKRFHYEEHWSTYEECTVEIETSWKRDGDLLKNINECKMG